MKVVEDPRHALTTMLYDSVFDELSAIQRGLKPDRHGWMVEVDSSL